MIYSNRFVCATKEYNTNEHHVPNPQFRKSFELDVLPETAEITICGLGYYELYVNGQNITKGFMAPYRCNLDHFLYYDSFVSNIPIRHLMSFGFFANKKFLKAIGFSILTILKNSKTSWYGIHFASI